jgi:hypothetical protein
MVERIMSDDLKIADSELLLIGSELSSRCKELEDILTHYQSVLNKVSVKGLDSALIATRIQRLTHRLEPIKAMLGEQRVNLQNDVGGFVSRIDSVDRF